MIVLILTAALCLSSSPTLGSTTKEKDWPKEMLFIHPSTITKSTINNNPNNFPHILNHQAPSNEIAVASNVVDTESVLKFIESNRNALCSVNPNGSFEFWISLETGGKVLGFGLSGSSGIKAVINCPKKN